MISSRYEINYPQTLFARTGGSCTKTRRRKLISLISSFIILFKDDPSSPFYYLNIYKMLILDESKIDVSYWLYINYKNQEMPGFTKKDMFTLWDEVLPFLETKDPKPSQKD